MFAFGNLVNILQKNEINALNFKTLNLYQTLQLPDNRLSNVILKIKGWGLTTFIALVSKNIKSNAVQASNNI